MVGSRRPLPCPSERPPAPAAEGLAYRLASDASEKRSGTSTQGRDELRTILDFVRRGDVLAVTRIDRLARSIGDLQDIVRELKAKGATLKATEQPIDTSSAAGKALYGEFPVKAL